MWIFCLYKASELWVCWQVSTKLTWLTPLQDDSALTDAALVDSALVDAALYQMDVPALSYIYAAYGKSGLISNGKE